MKRREFLNTAGAAAAGAGLIVGTGGLLSGCTGKVSTGKSYGGKMKLSFEPYTLQLRHTFTVASYSRTTTPDVQVKIEYDGLTGFVPAACLE